MQEPVEPVDGKAHYVVEASPDAAYGCCADPFLYAVGSCFVKGAVFVYVVVDFFGGEGREVNFGGFGECVERAVAASYTYAGDHAVCLSGEVGEYASCVVGVARFADNAVVEYNHGICGDEHLIVGEIRQIRCGLDAREVCGDFVGGHAGGHCFIDGSGGIDAEIDVEHGQELTASRGSGG